MGLVKKEGAYAVLQAPQRKVSQRAHGCPSRYKKVRNPTQLWGKKRGRKMSSGLEPHIPCQNSQKNSPSYVSHSCLNKG